MTIFHHGLMDPTSLRPSAPVTNYAEFEEGGFMQLHGTAVAYDDLPPMPILIARPGVAAPALATFTTNTEQLVFQVGDYCYGSTELTHGYREGTPIYCHIHWASNGLELVDKTVKWEVYCAVSNHRNTAPFVDAFSEGDVLAAETVIPASTVDRAHIITSIATISGVGVKIGAYLCWRLKRLEAAAGAGQRPAADPFGIAIGFHVAHDTLGSRGIGAKE